MLTALILHIFKIKNVQVIYVTENTPYVYETQAISDRIICTYLHLYHFSLTLKNIS